MATVTCAVTKGDLPIDITWMFRDKQIEFGHDIIESSSSKRVKQLTIEAVAAEHAGEYTCVASNIAGSVSQTAVLEVNGIILISYFFPILYPNYKISYSNSK